MIKRYHEAPKSIFKPLRKMTDGDYALVHLFEQDPKYFEMFKESVAKGRTVILDNSLFELREAFDDDRYAYWITELQPTYFIVPDSWKNSEKTIEMFFDFLKKHSELLCDFSGKWVGVAQGETYEDVVKSYQALSPYCDMVAFNLDFSSYCKNLNINVTHYSLEHLMSVGRVAILDRLCANHILRKDKEHHLLGCGVPQEVLWYRDDTKAFITSIDTSNPVAHGMNYTLYNAGRGIEFKQKMLMCEHMNDRLDAQQWKAVKHNVDVMKGWCN